MASGGWREVGGLSFLNLKSFSAADGIKRTDWLSDSSSSSPSYSCCTDAADVSTNGSKDE